MRRNVPGISLIPRPPQAFTSQLWIVKAGRPGRFVTSGGHDRHFLPMKVRLPSVYACALGSICLLLHVFTSQRFLPPLCGAHTLLTKGIPGYFSVPLAQEAINFSALLVNVIILVKPESISLLLLESCAGHTIVMRTRICSQTAI
jgi:hypothetical protein